LLLIAYVNFLTMLEKHCNYI